jgi:tRNA(Ile2) C34 agmatinyltransferase TiaS
LADPEVYAQTALPGFNKISAKTLPIGWVCPGCGDRTATKHANKTYCVKCGTLAISSIKKSAKDPTKLEVSIYWM